MEIVGIRNGDCAIKEESHRLMPYSPVVDPGLTVGQTSAPHSSESVSEASEERLFVELSTGT
jgi:hypothetical protein